MLTGKKKQNNAISLGRYLKTRQYINIESQAYINVISVLLRNTIKSATLGAIQLVCTNRPQFWKAI